VNLSDSSSHDLTNFITQLLDEKKAEDIVVIDMKDKLAIIDYMVIASGLSGRQVAALADYVNHVLKQNGLSVHLEGLEQCEWVLIDVGDVIVHIFKPEARAFYNLEKMWAGPSVTDKISVG
jgi:ribosome-associated protein